MSDATAVSPGPDTDQAVAKALGIPCELTSDRRLLSIYPGDCGAKRWWSPSGNIADAIEAINMTGAAYQIDVNRAREYLVMIAVQKHSFDDDPDDAVGVSTSLPRAICTAVLEWADDGLGGEG